MVIEVHVQISILKCKNGNSEISLIQNTGTDENYLMLLKTTAVLLLADILLTTVCV